MATSSSGKTNASSPLKANYWTAKKWFTFLVMLLIAWAGLYALLHSSNGHLGHEYVSFSKNQIRQINSILTTESNVIQGTDYSAINSDVSTPADVQSIDTLYPLSESTPPPAKYQQEADDNDVVKTCDLDCRTEKVLLYIGSEYENSIDAKQLDVVRKYIKTFGPDQVGIFLADHKMKVSSYFWLTGAYVYGEIIFWVIFGVICSLLFSIGNVVRRANTGSHKGFNANEIIYQVAKLFYAPFSAIIIVLAYSYFKDATTLNIDASEGVIVFAFIAGLYSGRVMSFLDKIKQLLLPNAIDQELKDRQQQINYTQKETVTTVNTNEPKVDKTTITDADILEEMNDSSFATETKKSDDEIEEVDIDLKLDFSGLFDNEKSELQKIGFNKAIVTLHNVNGKDIIPAKKHGEDTSTFVASDVRPGIYIARATLSQRLKDDHIINLFGEKTAYVTVDKPGLELFVKKYESVD